MAYFCLVSLSSHDLNGYAYACKFNMNRCKRIASMSWIKLWDHVNYSPPPIAIRGEVVNKVWKKFIEITSTNRNAN